MSAGPVSRVADEPPLRLALVSRPRRGDRTGAAPHLEALVRETLQLSPVLDATLDRVGFPLDHPYVENVWLPVLGPTSVLLLRRVGVLFDEHPNGARVDVVELAQSFGIGPRDGAREEVGRHSPMRRTLDRIVQFKLGAWLAEDRLGIHTKVPAVSRAAAERLPASVRVLHDQILDDHLGRLAAGGAPVASSAGARLAALGGGGAAPIARVASR